MRVILIAVVVTMVAAVVPAPPAVAESDAVVRAPVSFTVRNVNHSTLPCAANGLEYRIEGQLVGPREALEQRHVEIATLYLHEFSFGQHFWSFDGVPGYDFVGALAREGHVSVVIDRLGYGASGLPRGTDTCLGAQADIVAQIVRQLGEATYEMGGRPGTIAVRRLLLAGHSVGGGVAELAMHSFTDLDVVGLLLFGWADQGYSPRSIEQSMQQARDCFEGGEPADTGGPDGYAFFGRTEADFQANVFHRADPAVIAQATALRTRDPCGDNATLARMAAVNVAGVGKISVPVLLLFGDEDAVFTAGAAEGQQQLFHASPEVTLRRFTGMGHALTLELDAGEVRAATLDWMTRQGFVPSPQTIDHDRSGLGETDADERPTDGYAVEAEGPHAERHGLPETGGGGPMLAVALLTAAVITSPHWGRRPCPTPSRKDEAGNHISRAARCDRAPRNRPARRPQSGAAPP